MLAREARRLVGAIQAAGPGVVVESASFISYLPYDRAAGCAWLIEDDAEARSLAEAMIVAVVPVQE